jgi:hypothetical protein
MDLEIGDHFDHVEIIIEATGRVFGLEKLNVETLSRSLLMILMLLCVTDRGGYEIRASIT